MKMLLKLLCLAVLLATLAGCKTMQMVGHDQWSDVTAKVAAGDTVEVVTTDGRVETFVVTEVTADALVGSDIRVAREEISRLQVRAVHKGRTFGAAFGGAGALFIILLAAATASALGGG
jgi:predicted small secreted protein